MALWTALAVVEAHALDLVTFLIAASLFGADAELNPVARFMWEDGGPLAVIAYKMGLTAVFIGVAMHMKWFWALVAFTLVGLVGFLFNSVYLFHGFKVLL